MIRTPISPSASSISSGYSFWSSHGTGTSTRTSTTTVSSKTSTTTTTTSTTTSTSRTTARQTQLPQPPSTTCKLVWGLCSKNMKPGLLFTTTSTTSTKSFTLLFLPLSKSLKTPCVDTPLTILTTLLTTFTHALATIPPTSLFSSPLTPSNHQTLLHLQSLAVEWNRCAQVDAKYLCKGMVLQDIADIEMAERLASQPDVFELLRAAGDMFSCKGLGIVSPTQALRDTFVEGMEKVDVSGAGAGLPVDQNFTTPSPFAMNPNLQQHHHHKQPQPSSFDPISTSTPTPSTDTSTGSNWLHIEKHPYHPILQHSLSTLLPSDPILALPLQNLSHLAERFSDIQLSLNMWFAPYNREEKVFPTVMEAVEGALDAALGPRGRDGWFMSAKEREREEVRKVVVRLAEEETWRWVERAGLLRRSEHELNVWSLGLQRCARLKMGAVVG